MKLLVCISKTPDTAAKIAFSDDGQRFQTEGVQFIMNPYDEWYALVRALELKEKEGGTVTVIHVGPATNDTMIRKALAIGADDAVRIDTEARTSRDVAAQVSAFASEQGYDIIFTGKETIDYNGFEVGGMIAEFMDLPFVSLANHMDYEGGKATIMIDIEGGDQLIELETPFVLAAAKGLAEQRIPNMRGIMMAKRKPMKVIPPVETAILVESAGFELPPEKTGVKLVDPENMDELVRLLHEEAKVL